MLIVLNFVRNSSLWSNIVFREVISLWIWFVTSEFDFEVSNSSIWKHTTLRDKGVFFFHYYLANLMTNWVQVFTGLLVSAYVETHQVRRQYQRCPVSLSGSKKLVQGSPYLSSNMYSTYISWCSSLHLDFFSVDAVFFIVFFILIKDHIVSFIYAAHCDETKPSGSLFVILDNDAISDGTILWEVLLQLFLKSLCSAQTPDEQLAKLLILGWKHHLQIIQI